MEQSLVEQRNEIPALLDRAIDSGDVPEIVRLKKTDQALGLWIEAETIAGIKTEIKNKKAEKKSADQSLQELEPELVKAKTAFLDAYKIAEEKYVAYGTIQVKAFGLDQQHQTVTDDLSVLEKQLAEMKARLGEKTNGN